jgi:hypothetical protein
MQHGPKTTSANADGSDDGWQPTPAWYPEMTPQGDTRLVVSVPVDRLQAAHILLLGALQQPVDALYRRKVDRLDPKPPGSPPSDFVALELPTGRLRSALESHAPLIYGDGRCELWLRGRAGEQLVLDEDGVIYIYPDDPSFRDALGDTGLEEKDVDTMADRDYPKRWFHASNDAVEVAFLQSLGLTRVPHRKG